jgi:F-type H+-transporting ATPase subunit b
MHIPPDWGTFTLLIVSFLVFWFIFSRAFFRPFLNLLSERERRVKTLGEQTEQLVKEAMAAEQERERRLAEARHEALQSRDAERRKAESEAARILEEAKAECHVALERATVRIEKEIATAERELEAMARTLAAQLAERVLGRPLDGAAQDGHRN